MSNIVQIISDNLLDIVRQDFNNHNSLFLFIKNGLISKLAQKIVINPEKPIIIGVCGESASGKTTLAQRALNACLSDETRDLYTLITLDDYYYDTSEQLKQAGSYEALFETGFSFDAPDAFNLDLVREHINRLSYGQKIYSPAYDFVTCASVPNIKPKSPARVILIEGLFGLNEKLKDILDVAIYVHTPYNVIKDRWYKRAASRGKTGHAADMQFDNVNKQAEKYIRPAQNNADIVVSGLISSEYIEFMAEQVIGSIKKSVNYIRQTEKCTKSPSQEQYVAQLQ
ncbi:MAG: hypothetical protein A2Y25_01090 [Candidatus Melainabacteria bacterium GWF2_37_15]|nr:MAG: hypothetical protein A2Y25_01090 [Candidatus Melainabacteria bacterium GWF2_37_15]